MSFGLHRDLPGVKHWLFRLDRGFLRAEYKVLGRFLRLMPFNPYCFALFSICQFLLVNAPELGE